MSIRKMTGEDIAPVLCVDKAAFYKPWTEQDFAGELAKDYAYYCVSEQNGEVSGYAGIWCIYETADIIRIAVSPKQQKNGIGSALMAEILSYAARCGCERMMLEVRRSNTAALSLYKKNGFREISVRYGYYDGEDAIIMERII